MIARRTFFLSTALFALLGGGAFAAAGGSRELDTLHDALRLRPDQDPSWKTYVAAITPSPQAENRRRAAAMMAPTLETPRRVDLINAEMEADLKEMRRQGEAVKTFYSVLDADQKRSFDRMTLRQPSGDPTQGGRPQR
jgi:hypothetical protein